MPTETKHTPGPWAGPFSRKSYAGHALVAIEGDPGQHISYAIYPQPKSEAESQANARLIAAAPDLLIVVKAALAELDTYWKGDYTARPLAFELRAAIANAEGR